MLRHPKERPSTAGISRRDFLLSSAAAAGAGVLLAACKRPGEAGGGKTISPITRDNPHPLPINPDNQPIPSDRPLEEGPLKLYNWDQYIYKAVVEDFSKKYGVDVEISTFNNMDEALNKIRSAPLDFDVFFPTIDVLGKMATFNLIQPLNHDYLPNTKSLWPEYTTPDQPFYDQGQQYTVPYTVYSTGIGWRNDLIDEKDWPSNLNNPYDVFQIGKYKGKVGIYDDYREATAMALLHNGVTDVNTGNADDLTAAKDWLVGLVSKTNPALTINGAYEDLPKGIFDVHQAWSGDMIASVYYGKANAGHTAPLMSYWFPKNGKGVVGNDLMAILKSAKNPVLAHTFINYMLDFDNAMKNFSWNGYQPPLKDAPPEAYSDPEFRWSWVVFPNLINCIVEPSDFDKGYWLTELTPQVDTIWHDNWEEFTAGV